MGRDKYVLQSLACTLIIEKKFQVEYYCTCVNGVSLQKLLSGELFILCGRNFP